MEPEREMILAEAVATPVQETSSISDSTMGNSSTTSPPINVQVDSRSMSISENQTMSYTDARSIHI